MSYDSLAVTPAVPPMLTQAQATYGGMWDPNGDRGSHSSVRAMQQVMCSRQARTDLIVDVAHRLQTTAAIAGPGIRPVAGWTHQGGELARDLGKSTGKTQAEFKNKLIARIADELLFHDHDAAGTEVVR